VVRRPTDVLSCYRARKRFGAWLDGALSDADARWTERHVAGCDRCRAEVAGLRRIKTLVAEVAAVPDPDWAGFFPGIVRGIQDERERPAVAPRRRSWAFSPRWAVGSAAVAAAVFALVFWQGGHVPAPAEASVLINSAESENPGATVMVYTPPSKDLAVVWVFDND
jgi:anti-sigma factor RsiW